MFWGEVLEGVFVGNGLKIRCDGWGESFEEIICQTVDSEKG